MNALKINNEKVHNNALANILYASNPGVRNIQTDIIISYMKRSHSPVALIDVDSVIKISLVFSLAKKFVENCIF